jgi:ABC-type bacteriocin/lantibiotic exporter with double-glycine peptidase domain
MRMVCAAFDRTSTESRLRRLAGTTRDGTDHAGMIAGAMAAGATVFAKDRGSLDELKWFLRQGLPVIVGWWSMEPGDRPFNPNWTLRERRRFDCGHFSVVSEITDEDVEIVDPQDGDDGNRVGHTRKSVRRFLATWNDTDTAAYRPVRRWYMVMSFRPFAPLP